MTVTPATMVGSVTATLTTGTPSMSFPTGWAANDIGLMAVVSTNGNAAAPTPPTGWNTFTNNDPGYIGSAAASYLRLTIFWRRMQAGDTFSAPGGLAGSKFLTIQMWRGCPTGNSPPFSMTAQGTQATATTSISIAAGSTADPNAVMVYIIGTEAATATAPLASSANASLSGLTVAYNTSFSTNNGEGFGIAYGTLASAGASGTFTATTTSGLHVWVAIALQGIDSGGITFNDSLLPFLM